MLKMNLTEKEKEELTAIFNSGSTHALYETLNAEPLIAQDASSLYDYAWLIYELERRCKIMG